ncbi:MAG: Cof-type HAD-IIB family hydrolase [Erysipelotrichaceae bacterium]|nr:Cof-type HAD-IIB family hydrolase [Erysipelotrichaceae bacterium]
MIKLFATDLDGTFLNVFHTTDKYLLDTIDMINEENKYFVVATGRHMRAYQQKKFFKDCQIYNICMNGARILDNDRNVIYEKGLDKEIVKEMLELFPDVDLEFNDANYTYCKFSSLNHLKNVYDPKPLKRIAKKIYYALGLSEWKFHQSNKDILKHDILKINAHVDDDKEAKRLQAYIDAHDNIVNAPFTSNFFEITDSSVNKGNAIKILMKQLHISEDEVAVYGDGGNDVVMLEMFEHSYAPSDGSDIAKKAARHIIGKNSEYAVAKHMRDCLKK